MTFQFHIYFIVCDYQKHITDGHWMCIRSLKNQNKIWTKRYTPFRTKVVSKKVYIQLWFLTGLQLDWISLLNANVYKENATGGCRRKIEHLHESVHSRWSSFSPCGGILRLELVRQAQCPDIVCHCPVTMEITSEDIQTLLFFMHPLDFSLTLTNSQKFSEQLILLTVCKG